MPTSGDNVRFQVLINGELRATAGFDSTGVLTLALSWVRRNRAAAPKELRSSPEYSEQDWIGNKVQTCRRDRRQRLCGLVRTRVAGRRRGDGAGASARRSRSADVAAK
jgi:hypothetical protein